MNWNIEIETSEFNHRGNSTVAMRFIGGVSPKTSTNRFNIMIKEKCLLYPNE